MSMFHRYESEMHGNWRRAALVDGALLGLLLALYVVARLLMGRPVESIASYVGDAVLLVAVILLQAWYRHGLPDGKATLKELMLFGMLTAVTAAAVYAVALWLVCLASVQQTLLLATSLSAEPTAYQSAEPTPQHNGSELLPDDPQLRYWAVLVAIVAFVGNALLGSFGAFLGAIFLRNEKSRVKGERDLKAAPLDEGAGTIKV